MMPHREFCEALRDEVRSRTKDMSDEERKVFSRRWAESDLSGLWYEYYEDAESCIPEPDENGLLSVTGEPLQERAATRMPERTKTECIR